MNKLETFKGCTKIPLETFSEVLERDLYPALEELDYAQRMAS